jgi:Permuted papain-like amidase enzyme, YaeF/YiiX, C92 family
MAAVVIFKGRYDPWHPTDATGYTKVGYLTNDGTLVYPRRSRIARVPFGTIRRKPHRRIDISRHPRADQIEALFTESVINNALYVRALQLIADPTSPFWDNPIKLPILTPISPEERERKWLQMLPLLQRGDLIYTFDNKSVMSRIIRYLDQGTWSHVACYVGDGQIIEAITSGVVERGLSAYRDTRYRLGVYRFPQATADNINHMIAFQRSTVGDRYSYRKAFIAGARLLIGLWPRPIPRHTTPNVGAARLPSNLIHLV